MRFVCIRRLLGVELALIRLYLDERHYDNHQWK